MAAVLALVAALAAAAIAYLIAARRGGREAARLLAAGKADAAALVAAAKLEATATRQAAEREVREAGLAERERVDGELAAAAQGVLDRTAAVAHAEAALATRADELEQRAAALDTDERERQSRGDRARGVEQDVERKRREARALLESKAGASAQQVIAELVSRWTMDAEADAAERIRAVEPMAADPATDREARRLMDIASSRYHNHFLTERNHSTLRVEPFVLETMTKEQGRLHAALEEIAGVKLLLGDTEPVIRLDGQDPLGKEIARRAVARLMKKPESAGEAVAQPKQWTERLKDQLDQEVRTLGKKAFQVLGVGRAHPEIVQLVGALNWRTSYTQNQWLHAVEASFLAGMMAAELGLDEKLARRATLMHDIGKALTHKIEGSHAVIGADIARRLGEPEVVANAIGAHHADEPFNSAYAYLVAAADAMSGARPGARREQTEGFSTKVEDLERIGTSYRGVDEAHAVHGGRELRVYVRERDVDDLGVVELSGDIAAQIAAELTFPGQIKVTVIRSFEAIATAS
ncbi:MAG TPA: Rnase Y domain-containing protein [Kofleriaceae bacterium]|nr:Rnase Y domain-containing protein [Kofleriaceae bacterium]